MKKQTKRIIAVVLILAAVIGAVFALLLTREQWSGDVKTAEVDLCFFNNESSTVVIERREIHYRDVLEIPVTIVQQLIKGPEKRKNLPVLPSNTKVNLCSFGEDGSLRVDLSKEFYSGNTNKDLLSAYAIIKSICLNGPLYGINKAKLTVDKQELSDSAGNHIGYLTSEDLNLVTDNQASETKQIVLYFPAADGSGLQREYRSIKVMDQQPLEKYIVNELIKGPQNQGSMEAVSKDTEVVSVETNNQICFVNFKNSFILKNAGNPDREGYALYAIVNSLTELDGINSVQILIDGKKTERFGSMNVAEPLKRNMNLIARH